MNRAAPITLGDIRIVIRTPFIWLREGCTDGRDGRFNVLKAGELGAGMTWTAYLLIERPDDVVMWAAYSAVWAVRGMLQYALKTGKLENILGRTPNNDCEPPEAKK